MVFLAPWSSHAPDYVPNRRIAASEWRRSSQSPNPVFSSLDPMLALSGFMAVALMVLGLGAVTHRQHHSSAPTVSGGLLLASYGCAIWILYACR